MRVWVCVACWVEYVYDGVCVGVVDGGAVGGCWVGCGVFCSGFVVVWGWDIGSCVCLMSGCFMYM